MSEKQIFNMKIIQIKKYLGCILDETMSDETMALPNINKTNNKIKCLYQRNIILTLRQLLCQALIQPHFNFAC